MSQLPSSCWRIQHPKGATSSRWTELQQGTCVPVTRLMSRKVAGKRGSHCVMPATAGCTAEATTQEGKPNGCL